MTIDPRLTTEESIQIALLMAAHNREQINRLRKERAGIEKALQWSLTALNTQKRDLYALGWKGPYAGDKK